MNTYMMLALKGRPVWHLKKYGNTYWRAVVSSDRRKVIARGRNMTEKIE